MSEIRLHNVSKAYYGKEDSLAVNSLSLTIKKGTVFGFLGPNGAGKTTTMKMLVGLANPSEGTIHIGGAMPDDLSIRKHIGFMPESPSFYLYLTGREFLDFIAEIFGITNKEERIQQVLQNVDLLHAQDRYIKTYSKGMLQRLGLAQAIINNPSILFLDEPLDGLDPLGRAEVKKIILNLKKEGKTIFFNSHILGDVEEICDEVGIIDKGSLLVVGTPEKLTVGYKDLEDAFVHIITKARAQTKTTYA
jgi:ABC-2 type transport system ATP-binding protein